MHACMRGLVWDIILGILITLYTPFCCAHTLMYTSEKAWRGVACFAEAWLGPALSLFSLYSVLAILLSFLLYASVT